MKLLIICPATRTRGGVFQFSLSCLESTIYDQRSKDNLFLVSNDLYKEIRRNKAYEELPSNLLMQIIMVTRLCWEKGCTPFFLSYSLLTLFTVNHYIVLHDLQDYYYPQYFSRLQLLYRRFQYYHAKLFAKTIVTESCSVSRDITNILGINSSRIIVKPLKIYSGYRYNIHSPYQAGECIVNSSISGSNLMNDVKFFYPAREFTHKNHIKLVSALHHMASKYRSKSFELILTIEPCSALGKFVALSKSSNKNLKISCTGYLSDALLEECYRRCTAVVIPSLHESISIPVMEAQIYNKPVIVSNIRDFPKQAGEYSYFFDPHCIISIHHALNRFLDDSENGSPSAKMFNAGQKTELEYLNFYDVLASL
jgi:glycosyltransferase involved in cell wall biosynthesis